jgi:hypothetical protein
MGYRREGEEGKGLQPLEKYFNERSVFFRCIPLMSGFVLVAPKLKHRNALATSGTYFYHVVEKFEYRKWGKEDDLGRKKKERSRKKIRKERITHETCIFGYFTPVRARERKCKLSLARASASSHCVDLRKIYSY